MRNVAIALAAMLMIIGTAADAAVPGEISFQGVLRDDAGNVVPDGNYDILFRIYTVETGGSSIWSDTMNVAVQGGVFNVLLGSGNPLDSLIFTSTFWVAMAVDGGPELAPRTQMTTVPYAMIAVDTVPNIVSSVEGVANDQGDINLVEGDNITITSDDILDTITISATDSPDDDWEFYGYDIYRASGNVGIGTFTPTAKLDVVGSVRATGLEMPTGAGAGKVLTSDAGGVASWQDASTAQTIADVHLESSTTTIGSNWTQYDDSQVTLTVPGPGIITVTSSVWVLLDHTYGAADLLKLGHTSSLGTGPSQMNTQLVHLPASDATQSSYNHSRTVVSTFTVPSAGTYTYYLVGAMTQGQSANDLFWYAEMTGMYHPTSAAVVAGVEAQRELLEAKQLPFDD